MLSMKSVASALVLVASAADFAAPALVVPAVVLAASTARAQEVQTVRQRTVTYRDLNLASPAGMAAFQARVRHAAQDVCGSSPDRRSFKDVADFNACTSKAVSGALSALPPAQQQAAARPRHAG